MFAAKLSSPAQLARSPRRWRLAHNWHHLLLALGCAFVLLLLGSSQWQGRANLTALGDLRLHAERVERLDSLLVQLMDAENAVRGYLLTGNRAHLEPYEKSLETVNHTLEEIRWDLDPTPANIAAVNELSEIVAIKLGSLEQAIERGKAGEETRIKGKRDTDAIRDGILGLKARLATERQASFERSTGLVERTHVVVAALAAGALLLMAVLWLVLKRQFRLREQLTGLLRNENERLDALVQERTAELNDLASYLTDVREAEKARLARELHDELGALLTAAKMESGSIARKIASGALAACQERLAQLDRLLDSGITLKRRIIDDLRPPLLEELGLVSTLRILGDEFARGGEQTLTLELPEDVVALPPACALAVFRIAQEALTNIRKHAQARCVRLALQAVDGWLELEIDDDGTGFRTVWARGRHHGLAGMKHRVQMCKGEFTVISQPGAGTRIRVRIPLPAALPDPAAADQEGAACRT